MLFLAGEAVSAFAVVAILILLALRLWHGAFEKPRYAFAFVIALGGVGARPALAGQDAALAKVIQNALASPEPATAVLDGFASLPDMALDAAQINAALAAAGAPRSAIVTQLLDGVTSIKKSGGKVEITRGKRALIPMAVDGKPVGYLSFDKTSSFAVHVNGKIAKIDGTHGIGIGETSGSIYTLDDLTIDATKPALEVTLDASWFIFSRQKHFTIPAPAPAPPPPAKPPVNVNVPLGEAPAASTRPAPAKRPVATTTKATPTQEHASTPSEGIVGALEDATKKD